MKDKQPNWELKGRLIMRYGTQKSACSVIGMQPSRMSHLLNGLSQPSLEEFVGLTKLIGKSAAKRSFPKLAEEWRQRMEEYAMLNM